MNLTNAPTSGHARARKAVAWLVLGLSVAWLATVVVTDEPAWPLAVWIAAIVGPLAARTTRPESRER